MNKPAQARIPIVGIGASAGGIEAFKGFFEHTPPDSGMAFVVVLHLPVDRKSLLPEILGRWTTMKIVEATEACLIEANCVYVPPAGGLVTVRDGRLHPLEHDRSEPRAAAPIDVFFNSLAIALNEDAIGVVLSGTGSDGTLGLKAIKALGGLTLAQGPDGTAPQHEGMPGSAIMAGAVDIVEPVASIPARIISVRKARHEPDRAAALSAEETNAARLTICKELHRHIGHDFSGYKDKTFLRRVQRRMQVLGAATLDDYVKRLKGDRSEAIPLFQDLLIGVTSFFRDTEMFAALKSVVLPRLFEGKGPDSTVRVWVPACATGEEAYSLAILLREQIDTVGPNGPKIQIFATDIDEPAIATARAGRYPSALLDGMLAERLRRFFTEGTDGSFTVTRELRELCTFSAHSLTRDPPFSRIDLISCRNLLIYLDTELQGSVIPAFHYSLTTNGILVLGSSETISRHENLFAVLDRSHRIFRRRDTPSPPFQLSRPNGLPPQTAHGASFKIKPAGAGIFKMSNKASVRVLEKFAPAFVVVTADGEIVQFSSHTGRFLEAAPGSPRQNVMMMARQGLRVHLRRALKKAIDTGRPVEKIRVPITIADDRMLRITLAVEPMEEEKGSPALYLIVFIETDAGIHGDPNQDDDAVEPAADRQLEAELHDTKEQLQSITEEHETALEELRSANEELHSVNEELQSTNEELETSKEEIQSINEELQTVNSQLAVKVDELDARNSDLRNLFESTQVATVFLDPYLIIRGFTPAIADIYNLIPSDQGRPLTDIVSRLRYTELREDVKRVLATLEPLERRVARDDNAAHYLMRILPYRAPDSTVDGTLVTFVDVTSVVNAEQHQRLLVDELNHRVKNMLTVVISLSTQTIHSAKTIEEFSTVFLGRIYALAAAYSLLSRESWQTVSLREIIMEELNPFESKERDNIILRGPLVSLEPRAALALGMAVHELTTNAVKYGALSVPGGSIRVNWHIDKGVESDSLVVEWLESDGPPVAPPTHHGFGMTLIERGLKQDMSAQVEMIFAKEGLRANVRAPLHCGTPNPALPS
ncbi:MAG: methylase of chemotaxis methyl-accepting protein [Rhodospirillales bacterium]|nr:methylase of chemotaxis methyl-accepting protein [Rhodospirillales bacterium]